MKKLRSINSIAKEKRMKQNKTKSQRIVFLDYLRIFAFMSVLIGHKFYGHALSIINNDTIHATPRFALELLLPLFHGGGAGVVVFFLISGYIITFVLQTEQLIDFIIKRFFRIYPLYITAVLLQVTMNLYTGHGSPNLQTLIPQLLLIGDFLGTPYALGGVEWTLRIEIMFYIFMGILKYLKLLDTHKRYLPFVIMMACLFLAVISPIPSFDIWYEGYVTIYAPFLLLGAMFYLKEIKQISFWFLAGSIAITLLQYYYLISLYQTAWIGAHFATLSVLIFFVSWTYRDRFESIPTVLLLSNLTYSIYLFHNWPWDIIKEFFKNFSITILHPDIQAVLALFLICFFMFKFVEKPGIQAGRFILEKHKKKGNDSPSL